MLGMQVYLRDGHVGDDVGAAVGVLVAHLRQVGWLGSELTLIAKPLADACPNQCLWRTATLGSNRCAPWRNEKAL